MNANFEQLAMIIEDIADIPKDEISEDSSLVEDLDLSSIEIMSIVSKVEQTYSVKISEKELLSIETVKDFIDIISAKVN